MRQQATLLHHLAAALRGLRWRPAFRLVPALALCLPMLAQAQLYSYDGNRWYEMEVLVFRHIAGENRVTERAIPLPATGTPEAVTSPGFPLRELSSPLRDFLVDFDAILLRETDLDLVAPAAAEPYGPQPQNSGSGSFRLMDLARDPWVALTDASRQLARDAQRLRDSGSHELLWHQVWRQPMLGAAQTPAIDINTALDEMNKTARMAGEVVGPSESIQGSIRFTSFNQSTLRVSLALTLAPVAATPLSPSPFSMAPTVLPGWTLDEQRDILPETYHYFDTPAFGVLLQVRPYELPALAGMLSESDF